MRTLTPRGVRFDLRIEAENQERKKENPKIIFEKSGKGAKKKQPGLL
jgi:hypothetical protein